MQDLAGSCPGLGNSPGEIPRPKTRIVGSLEQAAGHGFVETAVCLDHYIYCRDYDLGIL